MKHFFTFMSAMFFFAGVAFSQNVPGTPRTLFATPQDRNPANFSEPGWLNPNHEVLFGSTRSSRGDLRLKSSSDTWQRLDSMVILIWDQFSSQWLNGWKEVFIYDNDGNTLQKKEYAWNVDSVRWNLSVKQEFSYDLSGNVILIIEYELPYETSLQVEPVSRYEFTHDANGNVTSSIYSFWEVGTSEWIYNQKTEFDYDINGNLLQRIYSNWDFFHGIWIFTHKIDYLYDTAGNLTSSITFHWDVITQLWNQSWRRTYHYEHHGNLERVFGQDWDAANSQWLNQSQDEFRYDANGKMVEHVYYIWDSRWIESDIEQFIIDSHGNTSMQHSGTWDTGTNQWMFTGRFEFIYDHMYLASEVLPQPYSELDDFSNIHQVNKLVEILFDVPLPDTLAYVNFMRATIHYSDMVITRVNDNVSPASTIATLYPNPVTNYLNINIAGDYGQITLELFDTRGRKVMDKVLFDNFNSVNLSGLDSGLYFYLLRFDNRTQTGKVIKK